MYEVRIFISYKEEFAEAAKDIANILRERGGRGLEVFLATEISFGEDWFVEIKKSLASSQLLLLLFTDPSSKWDWCLYEAGLFTDLKSTDDSRRRVICLHRGDSGPPPPLKHLQAVKADLSGVKQLLKELFGTTSLTGQKLPLNAAFARNDALVKGEAEKICQLFDPSSKHQWHYYTKYFELTIEDLSSMREDYIPGHATVKTKNQETLKLFGLLERDGGWRWDSFQDAIRQKTEDNDDRWVDELVRAAHAASQSRDIPQIQATFRGRDGNIYHPILSRSDTYPRGTMTFEVLLMETVTGGLVGVPPNLGILVTGLRAGLRLRYEVLPQLEQLEDSHLPKKQVCDRLTRAIRNVDNEVKSRGIKAASQGATQLERDYFVSAFLDINEKRCAGELYDSLRAQRKQLRAALEALDIAKVGPRLRELESLSGQLMALAAKRYYELICELVGPNDTGAAKNPLRTVG